MLRLTLVLCFGVIRCSAHVTTSTASPEAGEQQETSPPATETGDPHKIVEHSDATNVQVFCNGKPSDYEASEMRAQLDSMHARLDFMNTATQRNLADMKLELDRAVLQNTELQAQLSLLQNAVRDTSAASGGSVYTRWGSKTCPDSAPLLYSGVMGGSQHTTKGAAANALCLPLNPVYDGHPVTRYVSQLYGAEYEVYPEAKYQQDSLCAVCLSPRPYTVMVPATNTCHPGWTVEYTGYLMAGHHDHDAATEFICMDAKQDARIGSSANLNGNLFYYTVSKCGSLPCPPYEEGKIVTCVVCSK